MFFVLKAHIRVYSFRTKKSTYMRIFLYSHLWSHCNS